MSGLPRDRRGNMVPGYVMRIRGRLCCSLHGYFLNHCEECSQALTAYRREKGLEPAKKIEE